MTSTLTWCKCTIFLHHFSGSTNYDSVFIVIKTAKDVEKERCIVILGWRRWKEIYFSMKNLGNEFSHNK
jgi:hypothetical protein